jgi:hypothetical protein
LYKEEDVGDKKGRKVEEIEAELRQRMADLIPALNKPRTDKL